MVPMLPLALLVSHTSGWTGLSPQEVMPLMVGSSPISAGDEPELRNLVKALNADGDALALVEARDEPAMRIDELVHRGGDVGEAAIDFVRMVGYRTVASFDPMDVYTLERPVELLGKIRDALEPDYAKLNPDDVARVREAVPNENRDEFDRLLGDARAVSSIRDERDLYCNMPVGGVLRRAVLDAGRRASERGAAHDAEHLTEAGPEEIRAILVDGSGPSANSLQEHYEFRFGHTVADVPPFLGQQHQLPVDPEWLPGGAATLVRATAGMASLMGMGPPAVKEKTGLRGAGVSPGSYVGTARIILDASDLDKVADGDVVITLSTTPSFNVVLALVGAIVTEHGGQLSHAAIVARELGLPAIVGVQGVTKAVPDGARVRVDADEGELQIL